MNREIRIFFTALMFYTRIPCPSFTDHNPDYINKATRYFTLIGWIVGMICFGTYWLSTYLFDNMTSVILSVLAGVITTGAFHEDGLADVYDGFGGGWTKEKILLIMKDSRVGVYGVIALIFSFALKIYCLNSLLILTNGLPWYVLGLFFINYHSLARLSAASIIFTSQYAREDESSKAKPLAKSHSYKEIVGACFFGLFPLALLYYNKWQFVFVSLPLLVLCIYI